MSGSLWTVRFSSGEELSNLHNRDLREFTRSGQLQPTDLVRRDGMDAWVQASRLKGLFTSGAEQSQSINAPSPPPDPVNQPVVDPVYVMPVASKKPAARERQTRKAKSKAAASASFEKLIILQSRWPYRGVLLLVLVFICLPWISFSLDSSAQSFSFGDESINTPAVSMSRSILGVETDPGIIAFLGGLLAIGISFVNRWIPTAWAKLGSSLLGPCLFFGCWLYFFLKLSEHKLLGGMDMSSSAQSVILSIGAGSWLLLIGSISLGIVAVITQWERTVQENE